MNKWKMLSALIYSGEQFSQEEAEELGEKLVKFLEDYRASRELSKLVEVWSFEVPIITWDKFEGKLSWQDNVRTLVDFLKDGLSEMSVANANVVVNLGVDGDNSVKLLMPYPKSDCQEGCDCFNCTLRKSTQNVCLCLDRKYRHRFGAFIV